MKSSTGFSLIEFLIAAALSIFLLAGVLSIYVSNKKTFQYNNGIARLQENARTAIHRLIEDVRMTGFIGCARLRDVERYETIPQLSFSTVISGFHQGQTTSPYPLSPALTKIIASAVPGSDILIIQESDSQLSNGFASDRNTMVMPGNPDYKPNEKILISNCNQIHLIHIATLNYSNGLTLLGLSQSLFDPDKNENPYTKESESQISHWHIYVYYVAKTGRKNQAKQSIFALYRRDLSASRMLPTELVEGIDDMQIRYGIVDPHRSVLQYFSANQMPLAAWKLVRSVQIKLLLSSVENITEKPQSYFFLGKKHTPADRRLRYEEEMVVGIRE
jgi:type IV pilus assembly protein PilW